MKYFRAEYIIPWIMGLSTIPFLSLLSKVDYSLLQTNPSIFWINFLSTAANVFGFIGALFLIWQLIIGTRHFTKYVSTNTVWTNKLHRFLGTYGIIFILAHPILESISYLKSITWLFDYSFATTSEYHISLGRIALILFLIIWITSAIVRGKIKFRPWKYIHYIAYPLMGFVFFHALDLGTYLNSVPTIRLIWYAMLTIYVAIIIVRLAIGGGLWKRTYQIISIEHVGDSIIIVRAKPSRAPISAPRIGQYAYLQASRFHEAHPFTVMDYDPKTHELVFGIRMIGRFTKLLANCASGSTLLVDGPYGTFTREAQNTSKRIIIAGGIGVTPFVRLAKTFGKGMTFIHCNRTEKDIVWREQLRSAAERYIDVLDGSQDEPKKGIIIGRLDLEKMKQILDQTPITEPPFFVCGSPFFIKIMKDMLMKAGVPKEHLFSEELGFL